MALPFHSDKTVTAPMLVKKLQNPDIEDPDLKLRYACLLHMDGILLSMGMRETCPCLLPLQLVDLEAIPAINAIVADGYASGKGVTSRFMYNWYQDP